MAARSKKVKPNEETVTSQAKSGSTSTGYFVVARRYRPQTFEELVGQDHVATALRNAIVSGRVGHAYLFTGARGVGKTSTARILAKALNCVKGPTPEPCNMCDICRSIGSGDDIDVIEIDGASNRGIEEIRQLRQNAVIRPSRGRYKIYIIDEVHMLTKEAFNALLKTLEEPPEHVKFIFCTTEPNKVPVTILSRCQRFDFAGIETQTIVARLQQIVEAEGATVEPGVLELLARRAAGSMRDAQSLLEQLLSFSGGKNIAISDVLELLGMARAEVLKAILEAATKEDASQALAVFHQALKDGADAGLLIEQLLTYLRDCMVATLGCSGDMLLSVGPGELSVASELGQRLGLPRLLASMQLLDHTLARMRFATHDRILAELAIVRLSRLGELEYVGKLIEAIRSGKSLPTVATPDQARSVEGIGISQPLHQAPKTLASELAGVLGRPSPGSPQPPAGDQQGAAQARQAVEQAKAELERQKEAVKASVPREGTLPAYPSGEALTSENVLNVWVKAAESVGGLAADQAKQFSQVAVAGGNRVVVTFRKDKAFCRDYCSRPEIKTRFERALQTITGNKIELELVLANEGAPEKSSPGTSERLLFDILQEPFVRKTAELFGARPIAVLPPEERKTTVTQAPIEEDRSLDEEHHVEEDEDDV